MSLSQGGQITGDRSRTRVVYVYVVEEPTVNGGGGGGGASSFVDVSVSERVTSVLGFTGVTELDEHCLLAEADDKWPDSSSKD